MLASAYRRQVLRHLMAGEDDVASVEELVHELIDNDEIPNDRGHIATKLHHVALPKLAEAGFIEYDVRTQTARACEYPPTEWGICRKCGKFVPAFQEDETYVPLWDECPACGGTDLKSQIRSSR